MNLKKLIILFCTILLLLAIPFIAMQFTSEVNWSLMDFIVMGVLLMGTGLVIDFIWRKAKHTQHKILIGSLVLLTFLLIWAELAVGIFGTPFAGT